MHAPTSGWAGRSGDPAEPLTVVIDARIKSAESGGVEGILVGLAGSFSRLVDGPERYLFLGLEGSDEWLAPHLSGPARMVHQPRAGESGATLWHAFRGAGSRAARRLGLADPRSQRIRGPQVDLFVEGLRPDVIHMPFQKGFLTTTPSIYHPHDLQHLHFPNFFSESVRAWRELWYRELCAQAAVVAVSSSWTRADVVGQYHLDPRKVVVVPLAPMTAAYSEPSHEAIRETAARLQLPASYLFYPAQTWRHKNHIALLEALAVLRVERSLVVPIVFTGLENEFAGRLRRLAEDLGVSDQVHWLGFISPPDLSVVYAMATAVVIPSLFESASAPLWEAFRAGVPAVCSNVTSLPEQAGDAALLFNPLDRHELVGAIERVLNDDHLRARLIAAGKARVRSFTWDRTARVFRAHYRHVARRPLTDEDRSLREGAVGL